MSVREAAHVREIFNAGESAATPVIAAGVMLTVVGPLAAILILLDSTSPPPGDAKRWRKYSLTGI